MKSLADRVRRVKMLLMDVDGVMTDGGIFLGSAGLEIKRFDVQDGMGVTLARMAGLLVGILTGRESEAVRRRAAELGMDEIQQGFFYKEDGYEAVLRKRGLVDEEVAYVGDDILDIPVMKRAGLAVCVANGTEEAKKAAHYITRSRGGEGAIREVAELLVDGLGRRDAVMAALRTRSWKP